MRMTIERKLVGGNVIPLPATTSRVLGSDTVVRNGSRIGQIDGYIAAFSRDSVGDRFVPGTFQRSIADYRARGVPIPLKWFHETADLIGGWVNAREDDRGLRATGEIAIDTRRGKDAFALLRAGHLKAVSIGFVSQVTRFVDEPAGRTRLIERALVVEGSLVDAGMNEDAIVLAVKDREQRAIVSMLADLAAVKRDLNPLAAIVEDLEGLRRDLRRQ